MKTISVAVVAAVFLTCHVDAANADTRTTLGALYPATRTQTNTKLNALPPKQSPQVTLKCRTAACLMRYPHGVTVPRPANGH